MAFVVPEPGAALEPESLEQWCTNRLARYKRPREWIFVDDLPRTSLGKVRKAHAPHRSGKVTRPMLPTDVAR